eukprot:TRINITY_DN70221_c0_g1_i1.p1 TRINITY_DN70221_c0_g1~~TRINITY_DN70221_c0_g1_i1.p1  ORF type:complete len:183 (+),score=13.57 TRINITY_DN70221_c0_g1_i1:172-720(+)
MSRDVFRAQTVKDSLSFGAVEAATCYNDRIILACADGSLLIWALASEANRRLRVGSDDCRRNFVPKGKPITRLVALPEIDLCIALHQGMLHQFPLSEIPRELRVAPTLPGLKGVTVFTVKRDPNGRYALAAARQKDVHLFVHPGASALHEGSSASPATADPPGADSPPLGSAPGTSDRKSVV